MKKIFVFFTIVLSFLFLSIIKVDGMSIPNTSEVKFYNLEWVYRGQGETSDQLIYDLEVEIEPDHYEPLDAIISYELEELQLNGVVAFNFPRSKSTLVDTKRIIYRQNYSSGYQTFWNVNIDYIAVKKLSNKGIIYISFNGTLHELDYFLGNSSLEIIRYYYYIPDYSLDDAYNRGYADGYTAGKAVADENAYEQGYIEGWNEGFEEGYDRGYNKAYDEIDTNEEYMLGYRDGFKAGEKSKIAQNNEAFYKSIEKWLVPAIITVIVLGGIVSIIAIKRREQ
ncbi:MAG TPA: hypothetical protein VIK84_02830 [Haloplasmataceae bacterium]